MSQINSVENVHVVKARRGNEEKKREGRKDHEAEAQSQLNKWTTLNSGMFHCFGRVWIGECENAKSKVSCDYHKQKDARMRELVQ